MEQIISKQEIDELMKLEGKVTGDCLMNDLKYILKKEGEEGLKKLEDTIERLGYPIKYKEMKLITLYPLGVAAVLIIAVKRLFDYDEKKLEEMGRVEAKISSRIIRIFMKYFISIGRIAKETPKIWEEHYKVGELKVPEYDEKGRYAILRIENFRAHPFICQVLKGYFAGMVEMVVGKEVACRETKCLFRGDEYHEFLLKW